jgi:hypothetical protein
MLDMVNINVDILLLGGCAEIVRLLSLIVLNMGFYRYYWKEGGHLWSIDELKYISIQRVLDRVWSL